jgi:hypothetical protein
MEAMMANRPMLVVRLRVEPQYEKEFTEWYHREYLDPLITIAPLFVDIRRFVSNDDSGKIYYTIYEIKDEASIDAAMAVFDRPDRQEARRQWQEWEHRAVRDLDARVVLPIYPEPRARSK